MLVKNRKQIDVAFDINSVPILFGLGILTMNQNPYLN